MSNNGGVRFVKVREGLYRSQDGRFEIERIEPGTRVEGLSGLNSVHMMLAGKPFWVVFQCEEGKRYPVRRENSLTTAKEFVQAHSGQAEAARGQIAAHVAGAAVGAVGA